MSTERREKKSNTDLRRWKDMPRTLQRGHEGTRHYENRYDEDWNHDRGQEYDRDHDDRGRFSRSPQGARGAYLDRDREGYRSPGYDSRSRSRSQGRRSRDERRRRVDSPPPNKEIMLEGLASDMTEEDVRSYPSPLPHPVHRWIG
jgi:hypothetical protein